MLHRLHRLGVCGCLAEPFAPSSIKQLCMRLLETTHFAWWMRAETCFHSYFSPPRPMSFFSLKPDVCSEEVLKRTLCHRGCILYRHDICLEHRAVFKLLVTLFCLNSSFVFPAFFSFLGQKTIILVSLLFRTLFTTPQYSNAVNMHWKSRNIRTSQHSLPPHHHYDCATDLVEGATPPRSRIYPLNLGRRVDHEGIC